MRPTTADYLNLSKEIYNDRYFNGTLKFKKIKGKDNQTWEIVTKINDKKSGLQGAMVVPKSEYGKVVYHHQRPSQAIFVARGTEITSLQDVKADIDMAFSPIPQTLEHQKGHSQDKADNQYVQYDKFVNKSLKKYRPQNYSFTGHSLGGGLAAYEGVEHNAKAVSFAGANSFRYLTQKQKKEVVDGKFNNKITNYRHYGDIVPNVPFDNKYNDHKIGKQVFVRSSVPNKSYEILIPHVGIFMAMYNEYEQHTTKKNWHNDLLNKDGSIKREPSKYDSFCPQNLNDFEKGFAKMYAGKGGQGEKIKISPSDVEALASRLISVVENEVKTMIQKIEREAEHQFESTYREAKRMAYQIGTDLTSSEIDECLHAAGITHSNMVTKPVQKIKQQTKKLLAAANEVKGTGQKGLGIGGKFTATDNGIGGLFS